MFLSGLVIFLYGIKVLGEGLKDVLDRRVKSFITSLECRKFFPFIVGVILSSLTQSSTAAIALLSSMINAGFLSLSRSLSMMVGASVGATITTQLLALRLTSYSPYILFLGYIAFNLFRGKGRALGRIILGMGLIFFGMFLMESSVSALKESTLFYRLLSSSYYPFLGGVLLTILFQSSALTFGIAISMASQGLLGIEDSFWVVLGAHLATSFTVLLASFGMRREAQALAWASLIYKLFGSFFISILSYPLCLSVSRFSPSMRVAILHLEVVLINAILFMPFLHFLSRISLRFVFSREEIEDLSEPLFLEDSALEFPEWACYLAVKETLRVGSILEYQLLRARRLILGEESKASMVEVLRDSIHHLVDEIALYLERVSGMAEEKLKILTVLGDIKQASDILKDSLDNLNHGEFKRVVSLRKERVKEILEELSELLKMSLGALALSDKLMVRKAGGLRRRIEERVKDFLLKEELVDKGDWLEFASFVRRFADQCYYIAEGS